MRKAKLQAINNLIMIKMDKRDDDVKESLFAVCNTWKKVLFSEIDNYYNNKFESNEFKLRKIIHAIGMFHSSINNFSYAEFYRISF